MNTNRGLTLLEFLVTLFMLSILVLLTIPSIRNLGEANHLRNTAEDLYHDLQFNRAKAISQQLNVYVHFKSGNNWCYGFKKNSSCDCTKSTACNLGGKQANNNNQISMHTMGFTTGNLQIDGVRGIFTSNGTITFSLGSNSISVQVNPPADVTLCSATLAGYDRCSNIN